MEKPDREHFMWHCPLCATERKGETLGANPSVHLRKMGVQVITGPKRTKPLNFLPNAQLVAAMREIGQNCNGIVDVGTDG